MKKYKIEVLQIAREDIREARIWYNRRQKGLGKRLTADMHNTLQSISSNPKAFAIRYKDYRVANFDIFPYAAYFIVNDKIFTVYVATIMHTSRHPDTSRERL